MSSDATHSDLARIDCYLRHYAKTFPDREVWILGDVRWTYALGEATVDRMARALLSKNIAHGDRVAVYGKPRPEVIVLFLALGRIGATYVGLNPKYTYDELDHIVSDCAPAAIFSTIAASADQHAHLSRLVAEHASIRLRVDLVPIKDSEVLSLDEFLKEADQVSDADIYEAEARVDEEDAALLVYTSGSTGKPKGALLPHRGLTFVAPILNDPENFGIDGITKGFCCLPINHVGCMVDICSNTLWVGGTVVFHEDFDPHRMLLDIPRERISLLGGIPLMFMMMAEIPEFATTDYASVQKVIVAGNAAPLPIVKLLGQVVGCPVQTGYGLTECMGFSSFSSVTDTAEIVATTIGKFDARVDWRIVDKAQASCGPGTIGEIQIKGASVFSGYLNNVEATREAFTNDGWFGTGDLGETTSDGNVRLVGRSKEMFKSGGYNVYPTEIELALETVPGVAMAVVVAVPNHLFSEVGFAYIVPTDAGLTTELVRVTVQQALANYKVPKHFVICADLPMLPVGKVDRVLLRRQAEASVAVMNDHSALT